MLQEIRFHGRGGQGTVVASILAAKAFFRAGWFVQTFPSFGVERRGAPVEAYLRLDQKKIRIRSGVYQPDHLVVQDSRLLGTVNVTQGLKPGGWILLNARRLPEDLTPFKGFCLAHVDAARIATDLGLGTRTQPMINTAMVGAFAKVLAEPPLDALSEAIEAEIDIRTADNVKAARRAFDEVTLFGKVAKDNA